MTDASDEALIERCRQGDHDAFAEIVSRHHRVVFGLIVRTIGDRDRAEDLAQEVFLRVHRGLPYFRGQAKLSTWIYRIVVNLCAEDRAARRVATIPLEPAPGEDRPAVDPGAADAAFDALELRDRLSKAMAKLPVHYRLLVAGHYLDGVRYEDLAEAMQLPLGTVKTHLYRAKARLRALLRDA